MFQYPAATLKASALIAVGDAHGSNEQEDSMTLKGSNEKILISSTPSGSEDISSPDPGVSLRSTPGYSVSAFQAERTDSQPLTPGPNAVNAALTPLDDWLWQTEDAAVLLIKQFGVRSLDGYGLTKKTEAVRAGGACLRYAQETQRAAAAHISDIVYFEPQDHLVLDQITVRNLELVESQ